MEIPEGKRIKKTDGIGGDVSVTPHQLILEVIPPPTEIEILKQENELLKARDKALSERADFIEDVVAEMVTQVYQ